QEEVYMPTIIYKPESRFDGTGIYFLMLLIALAELIYIKERVRINRFIERNLTKLKNKKNTTQEV
ncbi:MAG: hypothetical protein J6V06_08425, partial [Clostridia bacterium]|nr:hypothetical protein [Clostridia bacterium]